MIRRVGATFYIYSKAGKKLGGPFKSKKEAEARLKQIEFYKAKGKSRV